MKGYNDKHSLVKPKFFPVPFSLCDVYFRKLDNGVTTSPDSLRAIRHGRCQRAEIVGTTLLIYFFCLFGEPQFLDFILLLVTPRGNLQSAFAS